MIAKTAARLSRRQAAFDSMRADGGDRNGRTKYVKTEGGKIVTFHRPGSNKKRSPRGRK